MSLKSLVSVAALAAITGLAVPIASASVTVSTVPIGNPGNTADSTGYGAVGYAYNIGQTEVTAGQYAAFLNAVARSDPNQLWDSSQGQLSQNGCGIFRSGSSGSYTYSVDPANVDRPVNYVTYWNAARFANWLHNGQPTGNQDASTTEDGAYTITFAGIVGNTITRNANAQWALPTEDEWYKAAYYQPASQGGDSDNYWLYPTSSNTINTSQANYNGVIGGLASVSSYAANFYGTFDMGGNVWEWTEATISTVVPNQGGFRTLRGGAFPGASDDDGNPVDLAGTLSSDSRLTTFVYSRSETFGFRVVQIPGPSSVVPLAIGVLASARRRRGSGH